MIPKIATASSSLMSYELGVHIDYGYSKKPQAKISRGSLQFFSFSLSPHALQHDLQSCHPLNRVRGPRISVSRYSVFQCRSSLVPSGGNGVSVLKTAAAALTRSYNALHESPIVLQLVPAVGIIAFAVWGLVPLVRLSRSVFLRSDNNWSKSSTHYVLTSYFQPLLLWTGAILICRVVDPMVLPTETSHAVKQRLVNFVRSLSTVLAFAYCLSSLIQQSQKFFVETTDSNEARNMGFQFAGKAIYTAVWVAAVSLFMELLGFSTQKWLTAGGLGTVLLTLAGREIFTNFLSSVMIHATRPFVVNEWIQTKIEGYEVSGTVEHVGWWSPSIIRGDDREAIHIPNHKFTMNVVRNLSQKTHWRIKTYLAISHLDVNKINSIVADMRKVLAKNPQVEQQRLHRRVFLENITPENQALMILVSCFVKTSHFEEYLCVKESIMLDLLRVISHHRARLATPIRTVQKVYSDAPDIENVPIADTIFTRPGTPGNRPFLLIEPAYKINGNDKAKASTRTPHRDEEKDAKGEATSTSDSKTDVNDESSSVIDAAKTNDKVASVMSSNAASVGAVQDSQNQQLKKNAPDGAKNVNPVGLSSGGAFCDKPPLSSQDSGSFRTKNPSTISPAKQDGERPVAAPSVARPALDDNIVLGVALEGSKRTLPIEEEIIQPVTGAEPKELAASRNGNGNGNGSSTSANMNSKDDQISTIPAATSSTSSDQREKER